MPLSVKVTPNFSNPEGNRTIIGGSLGSNFTVKYADRISACTIIASYLHAMQSKSRNVSRDKVGDH